MALLKKIPASTLMETMVATVLIVILFMMSSLILNSLFSAQIKNNNTAIYERLSELEYGIQNQQLSLPYFEEINAWQFHMTTQNIDGIEYIVTTATQKNTKKEVSSYMIYEQEP